MITVGLKLDETWYPIGVYVDRAARCACVLRWRATFSGYLPPLVGL